MFYNVNMITTLIEYQKALLEAKKEMNAYSRIAGLLLHKIKDFEKIESATLLAHETYVSNATITKFVKHLGFSNFNEMAFIHNQNKEIIEETPVKINDEFTKVADVINDSKKILLIGVSNSHFINSDFANKLHRINKWVVNTPSKYEQVGYSKILTENDLLIVNSVSLQHTWMIDVMKKTKAKIILISSVEPASIGIKPDYYFRLNAKERSDHHRIFTEQNRMQAFQIYDEIFHRLIEDKKNYDFLRATSYR